MCVCIFSKTDFSVEVWGAARSKETGKLEVRRQLPRVASEKRLLA